MHGVYFVLLVLLLVLLLSIACPRAFFNLFFSTTPFLNKHFKQQEPPPQPPPSQVFHVSDVVEPSEPLWAKDAFLKEASWAHHPSVMARIKLVLGLDSCAQASGMSGMGSLPVSGVSTGGVAGAEGRGVGRKGSYHDKGSSNGQNKAHQKNIRNKNKKEKKESFSPSSSPSSSLSSVPSLVVFGTEDHFTQRGSLELHAALVAANHNDRHHHDNDDDGFAEETEHGEEEAIAAAAAAKNGGSSQVGGGGGGARRELLGLPGGHLPHVSSPKQFAHAVTDFIRSL